ncbi:hypothetical protein Droror1_Dr00002210 [Drosera rotundifolia]
MVSVGFGGVGVHERRGRKLTPTILRWWVTLASAGDRQGSGIQAMMAVGGGLSPPPPNSPFPRQSIASPYLSLIPVSVTSSPYQTLSTTHSPRQPRGPQQDEGVSCGVRLLSFKRLGFDLVGLDPHPPDPVAAESLEQKKPI